MASALLQVQRKKGTLDHEEDPLQLQILALERGKAKKTLALAEGSRQDGDRLQLGPLNTLEKQKCALPENATWCQVRLSNQNPFAMAVRASNDVVSLNVCQNGFWEVQDFATLGAPGRAMDIGGNMGYFTFGLAHSGWNVTTFEPMKNNLDLINATLCANPHLVKKVQIHPFGLGAQNQRCNFVFHQKNVGNGITRCTGDKNMWWANWEDFSNGTTQPDFQLRRFDEVLQELQAKGELPRVDLVKIDVEGYECEVLKGAPEFISKFAPRLVKTEVWRFLERCQPLEYLSNYVNNGYKVAHDVECAHPETDLVNAVGDYYACKTKAEDLIAQS